MNVAIQSTSGSPRIVAERDKLVIEVVKSIMEIYQPQRDRTYDCCPYTWMIIIIGERIVLLTRMRQPVVRCGQVLTWIFDLIYNAKLR